MRGIVYLGDRAEVTDELEVRAPGTGRRDRPIWWPPGCATATSR